MILPSPRTRPRVGQRILAEVRPDHLAVVRKILKAHVPEREVWAFGSRATGVAKDTSDLDLVIRGDRPLDFATLASLRDDFSDSNLPYRIDVVDWATVSESFRRIIEEGQVLVQASGGG